MSLPVYFYKKNVMHRKEDGGCHRKPSTHAFDTSNASILEVKYLCESTQKRCLHQFIREDISFLMEERAN